MYRARLTGAPARGTLWGLDLAAGPPPRCSARVATRFTALGPADWPALAAAMSLPDTGPVAARCRAERRPFALLVDGAIAAYGWLTRGPETVSEMGRVFNFPEEDAYIWDCRTLEPWRGQRCYSALLSELLYWLNADGVGRVWIGADRHNQPSIKGFANAGFQPVLEVVLRRWGRVSLMQLSAAAGANPQLLQVARRALTAPHERRLGSLALGVAR